MTTALQAIREQLARRIGAYVEGTTSSAGVSGGTTLVASALGDRPNDYYIGWYVRPTSGSYLVTKIVSDFVQSSGTITVTAAWAGQIANSTTFELHKFNPDDLDVAIKEVLVSLYPYLHKKYYDDSIITQSWLRNGGFEWLSGTTVLNWAGSNSTLATETSTILLGARSLKTTATAANSFVQQSESQVAKLLDMRGNTATFRCRVLTSTASHARLRIIAVDNAGTTTSDYSDYHSGSGRWELLEAELGIPSNVRTLSFRLYGDVDATVAYWDGARAFGPVAYTYYLPPSGWADITHFDYSGPGKNEETGADACDDRGIDMDTIVPIYQYDIYDDGTDKQLRVHQILPTGRKLILRGLGYLTQPASDSATTEVDVPRVDLVVAKAAHWLYGSAISSLPPDEISRAKEREEFFAKEVARLTRQHGMTFGTRRRF